MNIFTYSYKSFRHHMGKLLLFMVALAAALCCSVLGITASLQQSIYSSAIARSGTAHVLYSYISEEQRQAITADSRVEWTDYRLGLRPFGVLPDTDDYISLSYSSNLPKTKSIPIASGHMPQEGNEILLAPNAVKALGLQGVLGEAFTLQMMDPEGITSQAEMVLCGLLAESDVFGLGGSFPGFVTEEFARSHSLFATAYRQEADNFTMGSRWMYVHFKNEAAARETAQSIADENGILEDDVSLNESYLTASLNNPTIAVTALIALIILLLAGILIIHSAFGIVVVKRSRQLGQLRLVGASRGQLILCVLLEGFFTALVALPLGCLLGVGLTALGLPAFAAIMGDMVALQLSIPLWVYGLTALLVLTMVFLGALAPAIRAGKTPPIESAKLLTVGKEPKIQEELNLSQLAQINLQRSKSRMRSTVAALSVGGILFLAVATVGLSMLGSVGNMVRSSVAGDIEVITGIKRGYAYENPKRNQLTESIRQQMEAIDGVNRADAYRMQNYCYDYFEDKPGEVTEFPETGILLGINEQVFTELLEKIGGSIPSIEEFRKPGKALVLNKPNCKYAAPYAIVAGKTQPFHLMPNFYQVDKDTTQVDILAQANIDMVFPLPLLSGGNLPTIVMLEEAYLKMDLDPVYYGASLYIDETKHDSIVAQLKRLFEPYEELSFNSYQAAKEARVQEIAGVLTVIFLIIFLIALIGMLNLISAVCIGLQQRQREFGLLYALGLSQKGFHRLLGKENGLVSLWSILLSAGIGISVGVALYLLLDQFMGSSSYLDFSFPWLPLLGLCLCYLLVPRLTAYFAARSLLRQSPVELIRQEE